MILRRLARISQIRPPQWCFRPMSTWARSAWRLIKVTFLLQIYHHFRLLWIHGFFIHKPNLQLEERRGSFLPYVQLSRKQFLRDADSNIHFLLREGICYEPWRLFAISYNRWSKNQQQSLIKYRLLVTPGADLALSGSRTTISTLLSRILGTNLISVWHLWMITITSWGNSFSLNTILILL